MAREVRETGARRSVLERAVGRAERELRLAYLLARHRGQDFQLPRSTILHGLPRVEITEGGSIRLGPRVTLNSDPRNYHAQMHSPVRLVVSRKGACIEIGADSRIHGSCLHARRRIVVGERCLIAANCQLLDSNGHDLCLLDVTQRISTTDEPKEIVLEDDVWLGLNCIVLPGVRIGAGTIVAAGSVVTKDLPANTICAGMPARVVRSFDPAQRPDQLA